MRSARHRAQLAAAEAAADERAPPARPRSTTPTAAPASPTYRVTYSSDDSISDGELHVQRRAGSLSAWYQRGSSRLGRRNGDDDDGSEDEAAAAPRQHSVTVVLHDQDQGGGDDQDGGGEGVSWESNTLYDYVRGLQAGRPEAVAAGERDELDSEEWAKRSAALRALLRERDSEVATLQQLLDERQDQLEGHEAAAAAAVQRCAALEERIRQLLRELAAAQAASAGGSRAPTPNPADKASYIGAANTQQMPMVAYAAAAAHAPLQTKQPQMAAYQPLSDSTVVQLPAQSYAEPSGCGFWQALAEGTQRHPRRCAAVAIGLALLLLVILCATLIPAAQRRRQGPRFLETPTVAGTGASWLDLSVQLNRPGLVSWMAFRTTDLNQQVPGSGTTLLELIQTEGIEGGAVYAASAQGRSLDPTGGDNGTAGLQGMAVACGWAPVPTADAASQVSVLSAAGAASSACTSAAAAAPGRCARCPKLDDGTAYTLLLAAASTSGRVRSSVEVVNALTGGASINVNSLEPPYADNATASGFDLHFKLNTPGKLYYAIALDTLYAPFGASQLAFSAAASSSTAVLSANPAAFLGGLVANGSVVVPEGGRWVTARVEPPCAGPLCQYSLRGLQGSTAYRAFLVAVDEFGTVDPAPAVVAFTTAPATAAPALLPATVPANVSDSGFTMTVDMDAAGGVYWLLATAKPSAAGTTSEPDVAPGMWQRFSNMTAASGGRRRLAAAGLPAGVGGSLASRRQLLADAAPAAFAPGSLVAPVCYPANQTCDLRPEAAFDSVDGLDAGFDGVASGCAVVPMAGRPVALPAFLGLQNNTLYYLLLASEDQGVPQPRRQTQPAVFAVRTVDLSAPLLACGFPLATNITATSFALSAMLTKPGASVQYVVLPAAAATAAPPSGLEVLQGKGGGGANAAAAGALARQGALPWEPEPAAGGGDACKMWAPVTGLQGGTNYSAFFVVTLDGVTPAPGRGVVELSGIKTPSQVAPSFTRLKGLNASVNEATGTFSVQLSTDLDRAGQVFFAVYRNYACITGDPSVGNIVAGDALPQSICKCDDRSYCNLVTAGSYAVPAQTLGAVQAVGGDVSPLPFQSLRNASEDKLKCFQGGLGEASDTYNIYLVAGNALPSFTGLAPQCGNFATAAAVAASGGVPDAACPTARQVACAQTQMRPDQQTLQSGAILRWPVNTGASAAGSSAVWQPPAAGSVVGRPARVQLSLEGGTPPAFTYYPALPEFPSELRTTSSFGMRFALDKPALLLYAVYRSSLDAGGNFQAPVIIATGRVPVFDAAANATTGAIVACPWAPGGAMRPGEEFFVNYVARDKYGRMDALCPGGTRPASGECKAVAGTASS